MNSENQTTDLKSLRVVTGKTADWDDIAQDCVCFANSRGGRLLIGIEDSDLLPPAEQKIPLELLNRLRKRISELTVNVQVSPQIVTAVNDGQFVELTIFQANGVASTSGGRYYLRVGDSCRPVVGDDVMRLVNERPGLSWEAMESPDAARTDVDTDKLNDFVRSIHESERVKDSVKDKSPDELLDHYQLASGNSLTHLGILLLGTALNRARLGTAPVIQFLKFDEQRQKINKIVWDDYTLSPVELVDAVWRAIPDFRETYELPDGMFRQNIAAFEEKVIRELLVNALVHRPYTQRGDIFLNLYPDRLEVVNPGRLPLGVTPQNILHASQRRNDGLARVFHDLKMMEREGSGFDLMYDQMLSSGRPAPVINEGTDSVSVTIKRRIVVPQVIRLIEVANSRFQLSQRERITIGLLAQSEGMTTKEFCNRLDLDNVGKIKSWFGRLEKLKIVQSSGKTQGKRYFIDPSLLRDADIVSTTTLTRMEPHRLEALIIEDLNRYPNSAISDIHSRIAPEIKRRRIKKTLDDLIFQGKVGKTGDFRWRRYWVNND